MAERSFTVLFFAAARTAAGVHKDVVKIDTNIPGIQLSQLAGILSNRYPNTKLGTVLETSSWSVNEEMVDEDDVSNIVLTGGEEVGVICPVSGG